MGRSLRTTERRVFVSRNLVCWLARRARDLTQPELGSDLRSVSEVGLPISRFARLRVCEFSE